MITKHAIRQIGDHVKRAAHPNPFPWFVEKNEDNINWEYPITMKRVVLDAASTYFVDRVSHQMIQINQHGK